MSLCQNLHGFHKQNQTTNVVQNVLNTITENATKDRITIATYIDFSKAFDCLQYDQIFVQMRTLGLKERTLNWFRSYLTDRTQCVDLEGTISQEFFLVQLGVLQCSILETILFLIYINDISNADTANR